MSGEDEHAEDADDGDNARGRFSAIQSANFVLRQKINGEKAAIALRVLDPFNTNRFSILAGDDNLTQLTQRRPGIRGVFLSYQYNFGHPPRVRQREPLRSW